MSTTNFQFPKSRFDFVEYLVDADSSAPGDTLVISAEFKNAKGVIEAELVITGYVSGPNDEVFFAKHLVPLVTVQMPLGSVPTSGVSQSRTGFETEEIATQRLRGLFPALTAISRVAQTSSGLVDAAISLKIPEELGQRANNIREIRQNRKMDLALEHLRLHWVKRTESGLAYVQTGKYKVAQSLVYFANLYSLARGMGVKEVRPRIQNQQFFLEALADYRSEGIYMTRPSKSNALKQTQTSERESSDSYDFAEMVAKLKRAGFLMQRP